MGTPLSGPGIGLPLPQYLYPTELYNAPVDVASNYLSLAPGDALPIPAGTWMVNAGYSFIQFLDPVTGIWRSHSSARNQPTRVKSDGFNVRVANLTGCPIAAVVTNAGSGYVQSSTTVTPSTGNSTWQAIIGGLVSLTTISNAGSGYGMAPLLLIAPPPNPGVQATGYCVISGGSVSAITITNQGAGYTSAPAAVIVPNPADPNLSSAITQAVAVLGTFGSGSIAAILCTNPGVPAAPTLTIAGAGTSGAATVVRALTISAGSVTNGGAGWTGGAAFTTVGGITAATPVNTNPLIEITGFIPRPAQGLFAAGSGTLTSVSAIYDGGLFTGTPSNVLMPINGVIPTTAGTITVTLGSVTDTVLLQPAP